MEWEQERGKAKEEIRPREYKTNDRGRERQGRVEERREEKEKNKID